jgi:O-antigen/teichoic acid export membrane protein
MFPRVAGGSDDDEAVVERSERFSRFAFITALGMAIPFALLSIPLLGIVYGPDFQSAALPIALLLPGIVAFAPVNVLASHLAGIGRPGLNLSVSAAALVVTVIFDLALIPVWGMSGAAVATSVSYVVAACITLWVFRRIAGSTMRSLLVPTSADVSVVRDRMRSLRPR